MEIEKLNWDSDFFGFNVGRVFIGNGDEENAGLIYNLGKAQGFRVVYVILSDWNKRIHETLTRNGAKLMDKKTLYARGVTPAQPQQALFPVIEYDDHFFTNELVDLALASGRYSRFLMDESFGKEPFERLYLEWLRNSINGKFADKVWLAIDKDHVIGFVTAKKLMEDKSGHVGLIAVSEEYRGKKVGKALMEKCNEWYANHQLERATVVTQGDNIPACRFYESVGYHVGKVEYYYHIWI
jgi:dTDP-4-amino-4,6-dideoxy-D-galactose acyltransferase